jgi:hypothetical protein
MLKIWPLLVLVSLKYCAEKRLLKTHVAFSMKVTVDMSDPKNGVVLLLAEFERTEKWILAIWAYSKGPKMTVRTIN